MNPTKQLGAYVRWRRKALRLTLPMLAAKTGVQKSTLSKLENGMGDPQLSTVVAISEGLKISTGHMLSVAFNKPHE